MHFTHDHEIELCPAYRAQLSQVLGLSRVAANTAESAIGESQLVRLQFAHVGAARSRYAFDSPSTPNYDVSPDGQRFAMIEGDARSGRSSVILSSHIFGIIVNLSRSPRT